MGNSVQGSTSKTNGYYLQFFIQEFLQLKVNAPKYILEMGTVRNFGVHSSQLTPDQQSNIEETLNLGSSPSLTQWSIYAPRLFTSLLIWCGDVMECIEKLK